jgi:ferredoxin
LAHSRRTTATWRPRHWIRLRKSVQYASLFVFVALFVWSRRGGWPPSVVNLPMRLDPLTMLAHVLASRTVLASSALALLTVLLTIVTGRAWCGWLCPLGTILDLLSPRSSGRVQVDPPRSLRRAKYALLLIILAAALLANLTLLVFDPLALLFRTLSASVWPGVDQLVTNAQAALYRTRALRPLLSGLDSLLRPKILPPDPAYYRYTWLYGGVFGAIVLLNLLSRRFWCRYLCPLGALLGLVSKGAIVRRKVNNRCTKCGVCAEVCPTGTILASEDYASDPSECTMCLECLRACPYSAIEFSSSSNPMIWREYSPSRREALIALGTAVAGISLFRSDASTAREHPTLIRPPGARENQLLSKCIRCAECSRACPTSAIQPAILESGLEGLWTPVIVPRIGYCDYSCNACGQVCPVQAIPRLTLEEKRARAIGKAYINTDRCLPWADQQPCGVCEEMCPVPDKAIKLDEIELQNDSGRAARLQRPVVIRDRCIGCGICEFKCPVNGEAAIRVFVPNS